MTAIRRNRPIYIVRSDSEDGVYDAVPYSNEDHQQLAQTLLGQLLPGLTPGAKSGGSRITEEDEKVESPATGYKTPSTGSTGLGAAADFVTSRSRRMPYFFFFTEAAGDIICFFHLPRRFILKAGLLLLVVLAGALILAGLLT